MKRCLIIGCSETKITTSADIPAVERYDGPPFRVLRRFLAAVPPTDPKRALDVFVLSAKFGLIKGEQAIPVYDQRMTRHRAKALRPGVLKTFTDQIADQNYADLFLSLGKTYLLALTGYEALLSPTTKVTVSKSPSGRKLTELKAWLTGVEPPVQRPLPLNIGQMNGHPPNLVSGRARLKGVELTLTLDEVRQMARQALSDPAGKPDNFKNWYVLIDNQKVAPKWLVSQLTNLPVSRFDASAARRVLKALGIPIYPTK